MGEYNYRNFPLDGDIADFVQFPHCMKVGDDAPTGQLVDASDGNSVELQHFFDAGTTVIEFGSFT